MSNANFTAAKRVSYGAWLPAARSDARSGGEIQRRDPVVRSHCFCSKVRRPAVAVKSHYGFRSKSNLPGWRLVACTILLSRTLLGLGSSVASPTPAVPPPALRRKRQHLAAQFAALIAPLRFRPSCCSASRSPDSIESGCGLRIFALRKTRGNECCTDRCGTASKRR